MVHTTGSKSSFYYLICREPYNGESDLELEEGNIWVSSLLIYLNSQLFVQIFKRTKECKNYWICIYTIFFYLWIFRLFDKRRKGIGLEKKGNRKLMDSIHSYSISQIWSQFAPFCHNILACLPIWHPKYWELQVFPFQLTNDHSQSLFILIDLKFYI